MDARLRDTERSALRGEPGAVARLLAERIRAGALALEDVRVAAWLGHEAALEMIGGAVGEPTGGWTGRADHELTKLAERRPLALGEWLLTVHCKAVEAGCMLSPEDDMTPWDEDLEELTLWLVSEKRGERSGRCVEASCGRLYVHPDRGTDVRFWCPEHARELVGAADAIAEFVEHKTVDHSAAAGTDVTRELARRMVLVLPALLVKQRTSRSAFLKMSLFGLRGKARKNMILWQRQALIEILLRVETESGRGKR